MLSPKKFREGGELLFFDAIVSYSFRTLQNAEEKSDGLAAHLATKKYLPNRMSSKEEFGQKCKSPDIKRSTKSIYKASTITCRNCIQESEADERSRKQGLKGNFAKKKLIEGISKS